MNLNEHTLQDWTTRMTAEQLGEIHAATLEEGLKEVAQPKNPKSKILGSGDNALKIEQLKTDLPQSREALLKLQNENFDALFKDLLEQKKTSEPRKIEVVHPTDSPRSQQVDGKGKEYKLASPKIKSLKQLNSEARNAPMNDIDVVLEKSEALKRQVATLTRQFDQVGIEGGARNKKIADQANSLQAKARELRAQLRPFKEISNENIKKLDRAIDEVSQIVEETQRNRKLVDGLGLETKPWHGKPLSKEEGADIIANNEIALTWKDVPGVEEEG